MVFADCRNLLQVAIENADDRPGRITLGVMLTDSASSDKTVISLGERVVVSSELGHFFLNRGPVNEILRFAIPRTQELAHLMQSRCYFCQPASARLGAGR